MVSRRQFVQMLGIAGATALAAACGPTAPPVTAPTSAPAAPKPTTPAQAATAAPATAAPQATAPASQAAAGSGNLPQVILDPARMPKQFKESPLLAEQVKAGKLPPLAQRLPEQPLVLQPTNEIGTYGGNWRMAFTGPADKQNMERHNHDHLLYWDAKVAPFYCLEEICCESHGKLTVPDPNLTLPFTCR